MNTHADNYKDLVETLIDIFHVSGFNMGIKVHFHMNHLDEVPANIGYVSNGNDGRFPQNITVRWRDMKVDGKHMR